MSAELKACPFCGGEAKLEEWENDAQTQDYVGVRCGCGAEIAAETHWSGHDIIDYKAHTVAAWNRRTDLLPPFAAGLEAAAVICDQHAEKAKCQGRGDFIAHQIDRDAIKALTARPASPDTRMKKMRALVANYDAQNPLRLANMHEEGCCCHRCAIDEIRTILEGGQDRG